MLDAYIIVIVFTSSSLDSAPGASRTITDDDVPLSVDVAVVIAVSDGDDDDDDDNDIIKLGREDADELPLTEAIGV